MPGDGKPFGPPPVLVGETITLRPLQADDAEDLFVAASDPLIWEQHPVSTRYRRDVFKGFFAGAMASGGALLVTENASGEVIGTSRYYDWNPEEDSVAIGYTFLVRRHWGGRTNAEMKRLMLDQAFRVVETVWFHVGKENHRSRMALARIGATYSHDGRVNPADAHVTAFYCIDAAIYSMSPHREEGS